MGESKINVPAVAVAVGAVGLGLSKLLGRSEKTNMSSESDYPPNGLADSVKKLPEWIQKGCGNDEYVCEEKGATFLGGNMPAECPDLSKHNSFFSENMTPELYNKLKDKKTKLGVTLGHCIKTGVDNPGHPMIKSSHQDMVDMPQMLNIQLIWMLTNFLIPKLIQPERTFWPPGAELDVPSVDSDFHQHALSKKDVKLKRLSSTVSFLLMVNSRVIISHFTDPDHMPQNQMV